MFLTVQWVYPNKNGKKQNEIIKYLNGNYEKTDIKENQNKMSDLSPNIR
jgi:hypothetical protein